MADSSNQTSQERTEEPTQRRLSKAREEGKVARSQELSGAVVLLAGTTALAFASGQALAKQMQHLLVTSARTLSLGSMEPATLVQIVRDAVRATVHAFLPIAVGIVAVGILVNVIQVRGVVSLRPVMPQWSRLSPLNGLKRVFSRQAPFTVLKSALKLALLSTVTALVIRAAWTDILALSDYGSSGVLLIMNRLVLQVALVTGVCFLAVAALDYVFQYRQHLRSLRMTKQEVLREHKETEGDPLIKGRIRSLALALSRKRMLADVGKADVVVTNPTHIAVALQYDPAVAAAPLVLAMGRRKLAERIKALALAANVPLVENPPLAHALMATATVGRPIPPALYVVVAEVLAFVYRSTNRLAALRGAHHGGSR